MAPPLDNAGDPYAGWTLDPAPAPAPTPTAIATPDPATATTPTTQAADPYAGWTLDPAPGQAPGQPGQGQQPGQDPYAGWTLDPAGTNQTQTQQPEGFFSSFGRGLGASIREGGQTLSGNAFVDQPHEQEPPRTFMGDVGYGVAHSMPSLAGAVVGAMGGSAVGSAIAPGPGTAAGGIVGGGLGMGAVSAAQELAPVYAQARQEGLDHDAAVDRAIKTAAVSGVLGAATYPLFELGPFRGLVSKFLFNSAVTMPATGAAGRIATPLATGQELPSAGQLATGYAQDVVAGGILGVPGMVMHGGGKPAVTEEQARTIEAARQKAAQDAQDQAALQGGQEALAQQQAAQPAPEPAPTPIPLPEPPTVTTEAPPVTQPKVEPTVPPVQPQAPPEPALPPVPAGAPETPAPGARTNEPVPVAEPRVEQPRPVEPVARGAEPDPAGTTPVAPGTEPVSTGAEPVRAGPEPVRPGEEPSPVRAEPGQPEAKPPASEEPRLPGTEQVGRGADQPPEPGRAVPSDGPAQAGSAAEPVPGVKAAERGPVGPAETLARLDAEKAPDEAYRAALSTGAKDPLKPGETWRSRLETWAQDEAKTRAKLAGQETTPAGGKDLSQTTTTAAGRKLNTTFEVHEAGDLTQASGDLQPRDRQGRMQSDLQRQEIRANLDPERLHASPEADRGSPIIDETKTLLTGNNRARAIQELHQSTEPGDQAKAQAYRDMIQRTTGQDVSGMREPVLVRRITDPLTQEDKVGIAREANVSATQKMSETEQAKLDAKNITTEHLDKFRAEQDLTSAGNRGFVQDFIKGVPTSEHNDILDSNTGALSQAGQRRLRAAIMARAYGDEGILSRGLESTHDETRAITSGLMDASQPMAKLRSAIESGKLDSKYDLSQDIARATDLVRQAREKGKSRDDILRQTDMFGGDTLPPNQEALVRAFYNPEGTRAASRASIAQTLREYARLAQEQGRDMLGDTGKQDPAKILDNLVEARGRKAVQGKLAADVSDALAASEGDNRGRTKKQPWSEPVPGKPLSFQDMKLKSGTSVYDQIFKDAGHDPARAVNYPIKRQIQIIQGQVKDKLGFHDVIVEPRADAKATRDAMMDIYRAAHDTMNALDMPLQAVSMGGRLALHMENKGRGYYGVYDPNEVRIGIVGQSQSLFHEWIHALDHHLGDELNILPTKRKLLSQNLRDQEYYPSGQPGHDQVVEAYAHLLNTVFYDEGALATRVLALERTAARTDPQGYSTKAALEAQRLLRELKFGGSKLRIQPSELRERNLKGPNPDYWASAEELLARVGESYIARRAMTSGVDPTGVAMAEEAFHLTHDERIMKTFPHESDRVRMYDAMDKLFNAVRDAELLGKGPASPKSTDMGITDPSTWGKQAGGQEPGALEVRKNIKLFLKQWANRRESFNEPLFTDPSRPAGNEHYTWKDRFLDLFREHTYSTVAMLETIRDRGPAGAKGVVQDLIDRVAPSPGQGRLTQMPFEQVVRQRGRKTISQYLGALKEHDLEKMTEQQGAMLRHFLTTTDEAIESTYPTDPHNFGRGGERIPIPRNIQEAGRKIRFLLDEEHAYNKKVGIELGYARNGYYPRMYDDYKIMSNASGFKRDAQKLHQVMFDQHLDDPKANQADVMHEYWNDLGAAQQAKAPEALRRDMTELKKLIRQRDAAIEAGDQVKIDAANFQLEKLVEDNRKTLSVVHGDLAATNWFNRINLGDKNDYETRGPSVAYTRGRELPPEADQIMRDWTLTNPHEVIPMYLHQSAQRTAAAVKFGPKFEHLDAQMAKLRDSGMHGEDLHRVKGLIEQVTGRASPDTWSRGVLRAANYAAAFANIGLLPRTAWSGVQEPFTLALTTGEHKAALKTFARQFKEWVGGASARERAEFFDSIGITTSVQHENIMSSRTLDYRETPNTAKMMSWFYRTTMLTQMTQGQRRSMGMTGIHLLRKWAGQAAGPKQEYAEAGRRAANTQEDAAGWLRELGIGDEHHEKFNEFMNSFESFPPTNDIKTRNPMRELFDEAIYRFVDQHIQEPLRANKAIISNNPFGRMMFSLMHFNYAFQRNVLDPAMHRIGHAYTREIDRGLEAGSGRVSRNTRALIAATHAGGSVAVGAATITSAALVTQVVYEYLFNRDSWERHEKDGTLAEHLIESAVSKAGLGGTLDPIMQIYSNARRDTDFMKLFLGAPGTYLGSNLQDLMKPYTSGSGQDASSNLQTRNQVMAAHRLLLAPLMMGALMKGTQMFPGGIYNPAAAIAAWYASSPTATSALADLAAGKKGTTLPKPSEGLGSLGELGGLGDLGGLNAKPKAGQHEGGSLGAKVAGGMLDDVGVPILRMLPTWAKTLGAGALGTAALGDWWNRSSTFRNAPPPKEK